MSGGDHENIQFEIVSEEVKYSRYLTVYDRVVRYTHRDSNETQDVHYDVVGHPKCDFQAAAVLPFHPCTNGSCTGEVTLIKEYAQSANAMMYMVPAGSFTPGKHSTLEDTARAELSEEAHLKGGQLVRCLPDDNPGIWEGKWARNRWVPYVCIAPEADPSPGARDAEEIIHIVRLPVAQLRRLLLSGSMTPTSITACYLALEKLKELGYKVE